MDIQQMYTSMEVEYDSDEDLQDVGNELNTWLSQLETGNNQVGDPMTTSKMIETEHSSNPI